MPAMGMWAIETNSGMPPPPRAVRRKTGGCLLVALRLFILPHMIAGLYFIGSIPARWYVAHYGTPVTATVDRLTTESTRKGTGYSVHFHYVLNRHLYNDTASVGSETFDGTRVHDVHPGRASAWFGVPLFLGPPEWQNGGIQVLIGMAIFWNAIVGVFVYNLWFVPLRDRKILRWGEISAGVITARKKVSGRGADTFRLYYTFTTASGEQFTGKARTNSVLASMIGLPVMVVYLPYLPKRNLAYEYCDYEVVDPYAGSRI
jgi:hypothetical protein